MGRRGRPRRAAAQRSRTPVPQQKETEDAAAAAGSNDDDDDKATTTSAAVTTRKKAAASTMSTRGKKGGKKKAPTPAKKKQVTKPQIGSRKSARATARRQTRKNKKKKEEVEEEEEVGGAEQGKEGESENEEEEEEEDDDDDDDDEKKPGSDTASAAKDGEGDEDDGGADEKDEDTDDDDDGDDDDKDEEKSAASSARTPTTRRSSRNRAKKRQKLGDIREKDEEVEEDLSDSDSEDEGKDGKQADEEDKAEDDGISDSNNDESKEAADDDDDDDDDGGSKKKKVTRKGAEASGDDDQEDASEKDTAAADDEDKDDDQPDEEREKSRRSGPAGTRSAKRRASVPPAKTRTSKRRRSAAGSATGMDDSQQVSDGKGDDDDDEASDADSKEEDSEEITRSARRSRRGRVKRKKEESSDEGGDSDGDDSASSGKDDVKERDEPTDEAGPQTSDGEAPGTSDKEQDPAGKESENEEQDSEEADLKEDMKDDSGSEDEKKPNTVPLAALAEIMVSKYQEKVLKEKSDEETPSGRNEQRPAESDDETGSAGKKDDASESPERGVKGNENSGLTEVKEMDSEKGTTKASSDEATDKVKQRPQQQKTKQDEQVGSDHEPDKVDHVAVSQDKGAVTNEDSIKVNDVEGSSAAETDDVVPDKPKTLEEASDATANEPMDTAEKVGKSDTEDIVEEKADQASSLGADVLKNDEKDSSQDQKKDDEDAIADVAKAEEDGTQSDAIDGDTKKKTEEPSSDRSKPDNGVEDGGTLDIGKVVSERTPATKATAVDSEEDTAKPGSPKSPDEDVELDKRIVTAAVVRGDGTTKVSSSVKHDESPGKGDMFLDTQQSPDSKPSASHADRPSTSAKTETTNINTSGEKDSATEDATTTDLNDRSKGAHSDSEAEEKHRVIHADDEVKTGSVDTEMEGNPTTPDPGDKSRGSAGPSEQSNIEEDASTKRASAENEEKHKDESAMTSGLESQDQPGDFQEAKHSTPVTEKDVSAVQANRGRTSIDSCLLSGSPSGVIVCDDVAMEDTQEEQLRLKEGSASCPDKAGSDSPKLMELDEKDSRRPPDIPVDENNVPQQVVSANIVDASPLEEELSKPPDHSPFLRKPRLCLDRVKLALYSAGRNAHHRGQSYEKLFSKYLSVISMQLERGLSVADTVKCRSVLEEFLTTKKLKKLHNKLVLGKLRDGLYPYHRKNNECALILSF